MTAETLPRLVAETADTVTLRREDYLTLIEDRIDAAAVDRYRAHLASVGADEARRLRYTSAEVARMVDEDVSPITIWRDRAGLSGRALASQAGISSSYLAEIEAGQKPGSVAALAAIAGVFRVPLDVLVDVAGRPSAI